MKPPCPTTDYLVVAFCAQWCGTCRSYKTHFDAIAATFPSATFLWIDIEDEADWLGDVDVENFPTLLIQRKESIKFFGTVLPEIKVLQALLGNYLNNDTFADTAIDDNAVNMWKLLEQTSS